MIRWLDSHLGRDDGASLINTRVDLNVALKRYNSAAPRASAKKEKGHAELTPPRSICVRRYEFALMAHYTANFVHPFNGSTEPLDTESSGVS